MQTTIKTLFEKGYNKTQIARMLSIDRKTVQKYLQHPSFEEVIPKKPHPSSLDPYREFIEICITKDLSATRTHQDLRARGFEGGYTTVRDYIRKLKGQQQEAYMAIETLPGEETQVDFGYIGTLNVNGKRRKAWVFVMVLSYSRFMFAEIVFDQTVKTFIHCHVNAFRYFGGVPETVKIDNLKAGVMEANFYEPLIQRTYAAFAAHYGFWAQPCRVYTPTDKGKVEKGIDYVKDNCFKGREFRDDWEAKTFLADWLTTIANVRIHGTTKKRPAAVFDAIEKSLLKPLNPIDFLFTDSARSTLNTNCHAAYKGNYYSAPFQYIGMELEIIEVNHLVKLYLDQQEIAIHTLCAGKGNYVTDKNHYPPHKSMTLADILPTQRNEMAAIGRQALAFFDRFVGQEPLKKYDYRTISGILALRRKHEPARIDAACERALYYGSLSYTTVRKICEKDLTRLPVGNNTTYINEQIHDLARDLTEYTALVDLGELQ